MWRSNEEIVGIVILNCELWISIRVKFWIHRPKRYRKPKSQLKKNWSNIHTWDRTVSNPNSVESTKQIPCEFNTKKFGGKIIPFRTFCGAVITPGGPDGGGLYPGIFGCLEFLPGTSTIIRSDRIARWTTNPLLRKLSCSHLPKFSILDYLKMWYNF